MADARGGEDGSIQQGRSLGVAAVPIDDTERKRVDDELRESEARFRAVFDQSAIGMAQVALDGRWMRVNDRLCDILGYARDELVTLTFADITSPDTIDADLDALRRFQAGEVDAYRAEKRYVRKDGSLVWVDLMSSVVRDVYGAPEYFVDMIEDIDDRKKAEQALRASEERYRALVEAVRDIVFVIDRDDRIEFVNEAAAAWLQASPQELIGKRRADVFPSSDEWSQHQAGSLRRVLETGEPLHLEHPAHFPGGTRWQATSLAPLRDGDGEIVGVLGIGRDITERRQAEQRHLGELEQLAHADALTGLLNRRGFDLLSEQAVAQAARAGQGVGVIYGDIDGLKATNDELGHAAGDQALRDMATVLRVTLRSADVIARVGGDEFVVLAVGEGEASIHLLAERLQEGIAVFNSARGRLRPLAMSCGVAWRSPRRGLQDGGGRGGGRPGDVPREGAPGDGLRLEAERLSHPRHQRRPLVVSERLVRRPDLRAVVALGRPEDLAERRVHPSPVDLVALDAEFVEEPAHVSHVAGHAVPPFRVPDPSAQRSAARRPARSRRGVGGTIRREVFLSVGGAHGGTRGPSGRGDRDRVALPARLDRQLRVHGLEDHGGIRHVAGRARCGLAPPHAPLAPVADAVYETDYILRIIQQMGAILRRMMEEMRGERPGEVYDTSREALQLLLGIPPTLTDALTAEGLVALLSPGGIFDPERGRLAAEVFVRRAQAGALLGDEAGAAVDRAKAVRLIALTIEHGNDDDVDEARALAAELG